MPKPRVKLVLNCSSLQKANSAQTALEDKLSTYLLEDQPIPPTVLESDGWKVIADTRFFQRIDAETFKTWVKDNSSLLSALTGSFVNFHLCSHNDAEIYSCRQDARSEFVEAVI